MISEPPSPRAAVMPASWIGPLARAIPAGVVGLIITFTANHSPSLGLVMLGVFGVGTALLVGAASVWLGASDELQSLHRGLALIAGVVGALAVVVLAVTTGGLAMLLLLVGGYAVVAGSFELVWGIRHRGRSVFARDAVVVGGATLGLAVVLALVADPVSAVGFFGAYAVMLAIFLLIAGFSLKWSSPVKESTDA